MSENPHGSRLRYTKDGCTCDVCYTAHCRRLKSYRARAIKTGTTMVDAAQAREVLTEMSQTMSLSAIGRRFGTSHHWVSKVISGDIKRINPKRNEEVMKAAGWRPADSSHVSSLGSVRRLRALHAMGYTWLRLAAETGYSLGGLKSVARGEWQVIEARNAAAILATYEQLSLVLPEGTTPHERGAIAAARNSSRKKGWPVPMAWNDPDDPTEHPADWEYAAPDRRTIMRELDEMGAGISEVCRRLDIRRSSLERWCLNNRMGRTFSRMVARESGERRAG